jgi:hypothetical protein
MSRLDVLTALMNAKYQRSQQPLKIIIARETQLRTELEMLKDQVASLHGLGLHDEPEMRSMGADIAWEKWLESSRNALNLELAKVLAEKQAHLALVRQSFGKLKAAENANLQVKQDTKKELQKREMEKMIAFSTSKPQ